MSLLRNNKVTVAILQLVTSTEHLERSGEPKRLRQQRVKDRLNGDKVLTESPAVRRLSPPWSSHSEQLSPDVLNFEPTAAVNK